VSEGKGTGVTITVESEMTVEDAISLVGLVVTVIVLTIDVLTTWVVVSVQAGTTLV
jgi:hypothetical protein